MGVGANTNQKILVSWCLVKISPKLAKRSHPSYARNNMVGQSRNFDHWQKLRDWVAVELCFLLSTDLPNSNFWSGYWVCPKTPDLCGDIHRYNKQIKNSQNKRMLFADIWARGPILANNLVKYPHFWMENFIRIRYHWILCLLQFIAQNLV